MPTLIVEAAAIGKDDAKDDETPPVSADMLQETTMSSKTPKKSNAAPRKRKVTPGTSTTKKSKSMDEEAVTKIDVVKQPVKKQKNLLSFFSKPAPKPVSATQSSTATNNNSNKPATAKSGIDKESLRDIVVGSAVLRPLLHATNDTPVNYEKHKGSPMPTNLKQPPFGRPSLTSPRERLLDRLNQQSPASKSPSPVDETTASGARRSPPASTPQDWFDSDALVEKDDDEKTLCFSQESLEPADVMAVEQPSSFDEGSNDVAGSLHHQRPTRALDKTEEANVQEVIVDMTQMDATQSNDEELAAVHNHEEEDATQVIQECIVDLTQIDSNEDPPAPTVDPNEVNGNVTATTKVVQTKDQQMEIPTETLDDAKVVGKRDVTPMTPSRPVAENAHVVPPERLASLEKNQALRHKTMKRMAALSERVANGLEDETFDMPSPSTIQADAFGEELSQQAVVKLAVIVQGSDLPLTAITTKAFGLLKIDFESITMETVSEKIKTYFTRENYIACSATEMKALDKFEDTAKRMWRWEIISPELLPDDISAMVKKCQTARRKIRNHSKALVSLLRALDDVDKVLMDASSSNDHCDKSMAKVSSSDENVLKFERAAEKARLLEEAKIKKDQEKRLKLLEKEKEKEVKEKEAAAKKEEETKIKQESLKKKEEEKQKKKEQQAEKKRKEEEGKVAALEKNKSRMLNFFSTKTAKKEPIMAPRPQPIHGLSDVLGLINASDRPSKPFETLSARAIASRKRRSKMVPVSVYVIATPDDPFSGETAYAEQRTLSFRNKFTFRSFQEDHRPAWGGTWSKRSRIIKGKTPFAKECEELNYSDDSEAEWEEGVDGFGEDVEDDRSDGEEENIDPIEGDTRNYNFEDGWMADDDDVEYENEEIDDETKMLRKKLKTIDTQLSEEIVAPFMGEPVIDLFKRGEKVNFKSFVHVHDEYETDPMSPLHLELVTTEAEILSSEDICMDAFPPNLADESFVGDPTTIGAVGTATKPTAQEMSAEDMKIFAEFVHHAAFASKDRLVEDLRIAHPTVTSSRAQATRKLDSIALKKKNPCGGVFWEVNREVLEELGLEKQLAMRIPEPEAKKVVEPKTEVQKATTNSTKVTKPETERNTEKTVGESKKRKAHVVSKASAALFAKFIAGNKKPKTS